MASEFLSGLVTLTFDDDNLKKFSKDTNKAVRLFLDRLRKAYGKQIRHWFVCEFGTLHGRPHYHGILFNVPQELIDGYSSDVPGHHPSLASRWQYGFVFVGYVSDETCSYITKYVTKSINGDRVRPRVITSFGIGENYLNTDEACLHKIGDKYQPSMLLNGFPQAMPRYYYDKIFTEVDKQNMVLDRFIHPPVEFSWQGQKFASKFDQVMQRRSTLELTNLLVLLLLLPYLLLLVFLLLIDLNNLLTKLKNLSNGKISYSIRL